MINDSVTSSDDEALKDGGGGVLKDSGESTRRQRQHARVCPLAVVGEGHTPPGSRFRLKEDLLVEVECFSFAFQNDSLKSLAFH
jgi:hypothetical protein